LDVEALTKQNGVRSLGKLKKKFKKKVKTDLPYLTLVPEVYFSSPLRKENNKNKPLEPG
jgi:hypothetical protein